MKIYLTDSLTLKLFYKKELEKNEWLNKKENNPYLSPEINSDSYATTFNALNLVLVIFYLMLLRKK